MRINDDNLEPTGKYIKFNSSKNISLHTNQQESFIIKKTTISSLAEKDVYYINCIIAIIYDFVKEQQDKDSILNLSTLKIKETKNQKMINFQIIRPFFKILDFSQYIKSLKNNQKKQLIFALIIAFLKNINLNHIICTAANIFIEKKWNKTINIKFNYTSFGPYYSLISDKKLSKQQFKQIFNYLNDQFLIPNHNGFDFIIKLKSLSVSILSVIIQNQIDFFKKQNIPEHLSIDKIKFYLQKQSSFFQKMLNLQQIQNKIIEIQKFMNLNIDLMLFFQKTLIKNSENNKKFRKWSQIILFFKSDILEPYQNIISIEEQIFKKNNTQKNQNYLLQHIKLEWARQNSYIRNKYIQIGIIDDDPSRIDLIFYFLYKYKLIKTPLHDKLSNLAEIVEYNMKFIKKCFEVYTFLFQSFANDSAKKNELKLISQILSQLDKILKSYNFKLYQKNKSFLIINEKPSIIKEFLQKL